MASHTNGHANGHGADEPYLGAGAPIGDDKAMDGGAFATVGEWLSARRAKLGLSLEEVAESTRVREDYLAAIEDMDPRRMPAGPYAPGFVRTYAIHLELDPEAVAARFREEMSPRRLRTPHAAKTRSPIKIAVPARFWVILVGAATLAGLIALGWRPREVEDAIGVPAVPEGLSDWVAADVQSRRTSAAPELVVGPDLALRARVPVWIDARAEDGEVLISRTLEAGEIWTAPRVRGVLVSVDNGAAVEVLLDGSPQERLGAAGLPVTNWRADDARGLTVPEPPVEAVADVLAEEADAAAAEAGAADGEAALPAAEAVAPPDEEVDESEQLLSDLTEEDSLVTPDLPSEPTIAETALPDLEVVDQSAFIPPDPEEEAIDAFIPPEEAGAAEGPPADAAADAPLPE